MKTNLDMNEKGRDERERLLRRKSLAIALILAVLAALFYAVTIVRLQSNVAKRAQQQTSGFRQQPLVPATSGVNAGAGQQGADQSGAPTAQTTGQKGQGQ